MMNRWAPGTCAAALLLLAARGAEPAMADAATVLLEERH